MRLVIELVDALEVGVEEELQLHLWRSDGVSSLRATCFGSTVLILED